MEEINNLFYRNFRILKALILIILSIDKKKVRALLKYLPYPRQCNPGVVFFKMGFWVRFNLKNSSKSGLFKKSGVLFKKTPKNRTFHITWGSIQEWGCIGADTVIYGKGCMEMQKNLFWKSFHGLS